MCRSAIYAVNTAEQDIALGGVINFGSAVRRFGTNCNIAGGNVVIEGAGYYDIIASFTIEAAAGTTTISLYKDGLPIPGATATLTTVADTTYAMTIPAIVRNQCCIESVITAVVSGTAQTVSNATIKVERI